MAQDILEEIVGRRKADIARSGSALGFAVPQKRLRRVHRFLAERGAILEVKRASPSKGDIAPDLDAAETAKSYARAGARAISCLTETHYFKGTLADLADVCRAVDEFERETGREGPAVLRKDFLLSADEVDVSYRAGADAVLLISRILDADTMAQMAKRCEERGMTALVELRTDEDCEKLAHVVSRVNKSAVVCGVNSRDLRDFTIDLLAPCRLLSRIRSVMGKDARVVFESGVRTARSASFVGSLGFAGMLLGEAAAKSPALRKGLVDSFALAAETPNARFWRHFAERELSRRERPLVKICGLTNERDARAAQELGADMLGFIFWKKSPRAAGAEAVRAVRDCAAIKIGVIVDPGLPESREAVALVKAGELDALQVHTIGGARAFLADAELSALPHYCAVNISAESGADALAELFDSGEPRVLVDAQADGKIGGTGTAIPDGLVRLAQKTYRLWLAGGVSGANAAEISAQFRPELVDVASGVERSPGEKDRAKLEALFRALGRAV